MEKCGRTGQATDENMAHAYLLHAGYLRLQTHKSAYAIITAFPPYQRMHERASVLYDTYIACLVDCWLQM